MITMSKVPIVGEEIKDSDEPIKIRSWQETIQNNEHKAPIKERIDAMTYIKPFPIKEVDLLTIKRFINFCRFNAKNDWGVGLKVLLDYVDTDAKNVMLYNKIMDLESQLEAMSSRITELAEKPKETKKKGTFGRGGENE